MAPNKAGQGTLSIEVIKQFPGRETADRRVQVQVPGKFFPQLQTGEQNAIYWGEAVEFRERHKFPQHGRRGARPANFRECGSVVRWRKESE
jgi:hypothetical protein